MPYQAHSHSPKSFACDNRVSRLRTFVRTLRGICESCAYEFSPARGTRVKKIIKHARAITKCSCTWNFPPRLRLFEHPAVLTVSPNVYSLESIVRAGNIQHAIGKTLQSRKNLPGLNDRAYIPFTFALSESINCLFKHVILLYITLYIIINLWI